MTRSGVKDILGKKIRAQLEVQNFQVSSRTSPAWYTITCWKYMRQPFPSNSCQFFIKWVIPPGQYVNGKWKDKDSAITSKSTQVEEGYSIKKSPRKTLSKIEELGKCCIQDRRVLRSCDLGAPGWLS